MPIQISETVCKAMSGPELKRAVVTWANEAGFDVVRFTTPGSIPDAGSRMMTFLSQGRHGDMEWMQDTAQRRRNPSELWPDARSVIVLGMNYGPGHDPLAALVRKSNGVISVYAQGRDYHDVVKRKLKQVAGRLHRETGTQLKVFVDTAPVMEKPLAEAAGAGWQGKHTNLVSREFGSWLFLGSIFTTLEFPVDGNESDHCGACRACLEICPTNAFPAPYQLDARRCISYLTIEHKGHIAPEFREAMGNRIFGCDDCLAVCPWNKFARDCREARFAARLETDNPPLADLLGMDEPAFRTRFSGTPVRRAGRDRFLRNVLIAAGNSADRALVPHIVPHLDDASPLVRAMAVWAVRRLTDQAEFSQLCGRLAPKEKDADVREEWNGSDT